MKKNKLIKIKELQFKFIFYNYILKWKTYYINNLTYIYYFIINLLII